MTTSRIVRGTKARVVIALCAILAVTAIIACYNSTLSQLEDAKTSNEICHQQEENLSTQLQVISDYKQRLEKSLKTEKAEHQQTRANLENKWNTTQSECKKNSSDATMRFNSLQQHFNLLKTEHDDFKEDCNKMQDKQSTDVSELQTKLQEVQEELKKINEHKNTLQSQVANLQIENQRLKEQQNENADAELRKELEAIKLKCPNYESPPTPPETSQQHLNGSQNVANQRSPKPEVLSNDNYMKQPTKSTPSSNLNNPSLNGVPPLLVPSVTPGSANNKKLPEGVVPAPENANDKISNNENNELPNARYANNVNVKEEKADENIAQEEDILGFGDNDMVKSDNLKKANHLGVGDKNDYKDNVNNDMQLEDNDPEDDDPDDYVHLGKLKDPIVRH